jgi:hypothetical protein
MEFSAPFLVEYKCLFLKEAEMNSILRQEADLTLKSDEEIKILMADAEESVKRLREREKSDPTIMELKEKLREYATASYGTEVKKLKVLMKALRRQAEIRAIIFDAAAKVLEESADIDDRKCEF